MRTRNAKPVIIESRRRVHEPANDNAPRKGRMLVSKAALAGHLRALVNDPRWCDEFLLKWHRQAKRDRESRAAAAGAEKLG